VYFGKHLEFVNIPPWKEEITYAYDFRSRRDRCKVLLVSNRRHKIPPIPIDLGMFMLMVRTLHKTPGWGTSPKCGAKLNYYPMLCSLIILKLAQP
jgi:hypothetical protein